ncbi:MAG TPA: hypothetical protein VIF15_02005 [Polyangiaceae bacterium]
MRSIRTARSLLLLGSPLALAVASACGSGNGNGSAFDGGTSGDSSQPSDDSGGDDGSCLLCADTGDGNIIWNDFPPQPIDDGPDGGAPAPAGSGSLFGGPGQGAQSGGPCLIEPEVGSLYPKNWLRPRFAWIAAGGENLFELRLHVANQSSDLVVYTTASQWTMPKAMWDALRGHSNDVPMTVSVRGGVYSGGSLTGEALGSTGSLGIAPVDAPGSIVYWTSSTGTALKGFSIGDENVGPVLTPSQVTEFSTSCIGCHDSTPDGKFASLSSSSNNWQNGFADVEPGKTGQIPPWFGAAGRAAVETAQMGLHTFSAAHWQTGDRIEISAHDPPDDGSSELVWVDLEAASGTAMGTIARTGDTRHAGAPSWSHDGKTIAYVSTDANRDGRLDDGAADVWTVPYNDKAGGNASALPGASGNGQRNFYPAWSPDDHLVAFDQASGGNMYNNALDELYVVALTSAKSTRLSANDPPACTGKKSPGVTNSWPKWAPSVGAVPDGRKFYWVVFSSTRAPGNNPQLYVTPIVVDGQGTITTYNALYLWNQPAAENNHTPAWDYFQIPPPPVQ